MSRTNNLTHFINNVERILGARMKDDHGNGSGSHGMPHGMPEGTIKEVYSQIKEHGDSKVSSQYMKNMQNKLRHSPS